MKDYLLVILSVVLLAITFVAQKFYQRHVDDSTRGGVHYSILSGICSLVILGITSGFSLSFTWYSAINALLRSACCLAYSLIGFRIMREASVAFYMLFLMSGGMLLPSVWGWLFLGEEPKLLHVIGLLMILGSLAVNNLGKERLSPKILLMCSAVFVLNGFVSVFSKLHQTTTQFATIPTLDYTLFSTLTTLAMSLILLFFVKKSDAPKAENSKKRFCLPLLIVPSASLIGTISSYLQLEGAKNLPASMLYPMITGGNVVFTGLFALLFFGEKLSKRGWISVALCCVGTVFFI